MVENLQQPECTAWWKSEFGSARFWLVRFETGGQLGTKHLVLQLNSTLKHVSFWKHFRQCRILVHIWSTLPNLQFDLSLLSHPSLDPREAAFSLDVLNLFVQRDKSVQVQSVVWTTAQGPAKGQNHTFTQVGDSNSVPCCKSHKRPELYEFHCSDWSATEKMMDEEDLGGRQFIFQNKTDNLFPFCWRTLLFSHFLANVSVFIMLHDEIGRIYLSLKLKHTGCNKMVMLARKWLNDNVVVYS